MKIGELAELFSVSRDTIRYYINEGLLVPQTGTQYDFGPREVEELQLILRMKEQQFSLQKIAEMLTLRRTSNMVEPATISSCIELLENKRLELQGQIEQLQRAADSIIADEQKLSSQVRSPNVHLGVPLKALELLVCPRCGSQFELRDASLSAKYVFSGRLCCACGYEITVENDIVRTGNLYTGGHDAPDLGRDLYRDIGEEFVACTQKAQDMLIRDLSAMDLRNKVVMETHINAYFFAYRHMKAFPGGCLYVVTDKYPEMLEMYKNLIEMLNEDRDILFIADNSAELPLRKNSVDLLIDSMSDNEHSLYSKVPYIEMVKPYLKPDAPIIGMFIGFKGSTLSQKQIHQKYPEGAFPLFSLEQLPVLYRNSGYDLETHVAGTMAKTKKVGKFIFECHVDGEILYLVSLKATPAGGGAR